MRCKVRVLPVDLVVEVERESLLQDAIERAGVQLDLPCGGQGRCGRCTVIVREGEVRRRSVARLAPEQIAQGYALACQTLVMSDLVVMVPPADAPTIRPKTTLEAVGVGPTMVKCAPGVSPCVQKYHLVIEPPSLADNTTDFERLKRELARQYGVRELTTSLSVLRRLAGVLREANWNVTVVVVSGLSGETLFPPRLIDVRPGNGMGVTLGLGVDIGTTSNVVYLADMESCSILDHISAYNGQISCGEDIISRIIYARRPGGLERLQELVIGTINDLIDELLTRHGYIADDLYLMTVAGNPTMIHLFLGLDPQYIRLEPYLPTINHPPPVLGSELGLHINPEAFVDCLPSVGAYVGADITAGVLRSGMDDEEAITLFIDVGTNGEIVLGNSDWLISCACSAGPAFEGAGVASGMRAADGAIEEVWIQADTAEPTYSTIGDAPPRGICGSGMISLLGEMFLTRVVDKGGRIDRRIDSPRVRVRDGVAEYVVAWADETATGRRDIVLTEIDIENLLRAKAAIYAGMEVLTSSVGLGLGDVERILIGGAFGQYIDIEKAIAIGLLPDMPWDRFHYLGNTSVQGAYLSLLCREMRSQVSDLAAKMTYLELSADNSFMESFTSALFLPHTDITQFPSVGEKLQMTE